MKKEFQILVSLFILYMPVPALANNSLWDIPEINKGLFYIGLAYGIDENCDKVTINKVPAIFYGWRLSNIGKKAGYETSEIRAFIKDKDEKEVLRNRVIKYLKYKGVDPKIPNALCEMGEMEISRNSQVGALLRVK